MGTMPRPSGSEKKNERNVQKLLSRLQGRRVQKLPSHGYRRTNSLRSGSKAGSHGFLARLFGRTMARNSHPPSAPAAAASPPVDRRCWGPCPDRVGSCARRPPRPRSAPPRPPLCPPPRPPLCPGPDRRSPPAPTAALPPAPTPARRRASAPLPGPVLLYRVRHRRREISLPTSFSKLASPARASPGITAASLAPLWSRRHRVVLLSGILGRASWSRRPFGP